MQIEWKDCPEPFRKALQACGQAGGQVRVESATTFSSHGAMNRGCRGVACAVDLATGALTNVAMGSWGGVNPFESNPVDYAKDVPIPVGSAVVVGETGYKTYLTVYVRPENFAPLLPAQVELTPEQHKLLAVLAGYNSTGRKNYFDRHGKPVEADVAALVSLGLVTRNKAGAMQVTAAGRNAEASGPYKHRTPY